MSQPFPKINLQPCNGQQLRFRDSLFSHCNNRYLFSCGACHRATTSLGSRGIGFWTTIRFGLSGAAGLGTVSLTGLFGRVALGCFRTFCVGFFS